MHSIASMQNRGSQEKTYFMQIESFLQIAKKKSRRLIGG